MPIYRTDHDVKLHCYFFRRYHVGAWKRKTRDKVSDNSRSVAKNHGYGGLKLLRKLTRKMADVCAWSTKDAFPKRYGSSDSVRLSAQS